MVLLRKILLPLFMFVALAGYGQTIYYASPTGSDATGTGTEINPWASLYKATTTVTSSGDMIWLIEGTYTETSQSALAIGVDIGADEGVYVTSSSALNPILTVNSTAGNAIDGSQTISNINFDGNLTAYSAISVNFRSNVTIELCTFTDFYYNAVVMDGMTSSWNVTPSNTLPTGNEITYCTFTNNTCYTGGTSGHIRPEGQSGLEISYCDFDQTGRAAGQNADIIAGYQNDGLKIHHCTFTKDDTNGEDWNFFAELHYSHGGFELYNNTFNGGACFDFSGSVKGTYDFGGQIHDNTFQTTTYPAIGGHLQAYLDLESFDYENDIYVYRNHFKYSKQGVSLNNIGTSADNVWIYYNLFEEVGNTTTSYSNAIQVSSNWDATDATPVSNVHILNNTIYTSQANLEAITISNTLGDIDGLTIANNIVYGNFTYAIGINSTGTPEITDLTIANNLLDYNTANIHWQGTITYTNRDTTDNINDNPMFVSSSDFSLQSTSPCIDAGIDVYLTTDYDGETVPSGALPDIGAYEYQGTTPTPGATTTGFCKTSSTKFGKSASGKFVKL